MDEYRSTVLCRSPFPSVIKTPAVFQLGRLLRQHYGCMCTGSQGRIYSPGQIEIDRQVGVVGHFKARPQSIFIYASRAHVEIFYYNKRLWRVAAAAAVGRVSREGWKRYIREKERERERSTENRGEQGKERGRKRGTKRTREKQRTLGI